MHCKSVLLFYIQVQDKHTVRVAPLYLIGLQPSEFAVETDKNAWTVAVGLAGAVICKRAEKLLPPPLASSPSNPQATHRQ